MKYKDNAMYADMQIMADARLTLQEDETELCYICSTRIKMDRGEYCAMCGRFVCEGHATHRHPFICKYCS